MKESEHNAHHALVLTVQTQDERREALRRAMLRAPGKAPRSPHKPESALGLGLTLATAALSLAGLILVIFVYL